MKSEIFCYLSLIAVTQCVPLNSDLLQKSTLSLPTDTRNLSRNSDETIIIATANAYGDKIVANINQLVEKLGFDPRSVEDIKKGYWWGNLKLTQTHVDGLSTLFRCGDTEMEYCHETKQLQVRMRLGFQNLRFESHYKISLIGIGPKGRITGEVNNLEMLTSLTIDYQVNQCYIRKYEITKSGHILIKLHGHPLTDWFYNAMLNSTTAIFKGLILDIVDYVVQNIMNSIADSIDILLIKYLS